jgi:hypothetical protein
MFGLGLIPKKREDVDNRDLLYSVLFNVKRYSDKVILDARQVLDQRAFGTCVVFAIVAALNRFFRRLMSPLMIYRFTKEIDSFPDQEGTTPQWGLKALIKKGTVPEEEYPYSNYEKALEFPEITKDLECLAEDYKIDAYVKITTKEELIDHLMHGQGAVAGLMVGLKSLFNPDILPNGDAVIDVPGLVPNDTVAGHAVYILGADCRMTHTHSKSGITRTGYAKFVNSWGTGKSRREFGTGEEIVWSETGHGWIPFDYLFGTMYAPDGSQTPYVNEIFVPLKDIPFDIQKIDPGNINIAPGIKNGRTLVPLRFIGEALGMDVLYTEHDRGITISKNGLLVKLNVDSTDMQVNNNFINLDVPPEVKEGRTFVPLRAVAEAFGAEVNYFGYEQKVEIKYQDIILEMWIGRNEARKIKRL